MQTEIEAKFLHVDHAAIRDKLTELGATCKQPMRLMRRKNYDFSDGRLSTERNGWVRVRDEGDKITMSYKQLDDRGLHGTKEVNLTVDSFEQADAFLTALGLEPTSYQETKRESWTLDGADIELDVWPWILPYLEIEGSDESTVKAIAAKLGLDWSAAQHGSVEVAYHAEYDTTDQEIDDIPVITFEEPIPEWLEAKRKANV